MSNYTPYILKQSLKSINRFLYWLVDPEIKSDFTISFIKICLNRISNSLRNVTNNFKNSRTNNACQESEQLLHCILLKYKTDISIWISKEVWMLSLANDKSLNYLESNKNTIISHSPAGTGNPFKLFDNKIFITP